MKISEIIKESNDTFGIIEIIDDKEFKTLGLSSAKVGFEFCTFIDDEKYMDSISQNATMIITKADIAKKIECKGICISENPRISFFKLHNYLSNKEAYTLCKDYKTKIGDNCSISSLAHIAEKNIIIGNNVTIEEFVSIKENTIIGDNTIIRAGAVIGGEGFEFKRMSDRVLSVKHVGWSIIGDSVEIKYNSCVDKAIYPWDRTIIGNNCRISNLSQIAHGVKIGEGVFIAANTAIGGRTVIGQDSWVGIGVTISNRLNIGKNSRLNIGSVVTKDVDDNSSVTGNFAIDHKKFIKFIKSIR